VNFGCRGLMQRDVGRPVAALELLAGATWAWVVSAGIRRHVELSQFSPGLHVPARIPSSCRHVNFEILSKDRRGGCGAVGLVAAIAVDHVQKRLACRDAAHILEHHVQCLRQILIFVV
jgi:hypothetical protein